MMASVAPHVSGIPQQSIWEEHKPMFVQLYVKEKKTLRQVKAIAEEDFGFPQTPDLGLKKKLKWFDWIAIHDHISHLGNPKVDVLLNGDLIPRAKVKKEINRNLKRRSSIPDPLRFPEGVEIRLVSQEITLYDRQVVSISPAVPQTFMVDAAPIMQPSSTDIQPASRFIPPYNIASNQLGVFSVFDPPLVDNCFGSSEMPMEVAESSFLGTAEEATHIISRLSVSLQETYDFLTSRFTRHRSVTGILVLDPEFQKFWSPMLGHLPIMRALVDPAASHLQSQGSDYSWPSDEDFFINIGDTPTLQYLSPAEHRHQELILPVHEFDQEMVPPIYAPLSTSRDVFHVINGVLYLFSNNPDKDEAFEYVRKLVAQDMPWSIVEAILRIPSRTIQSIWELLADCAFKLYVRRLFDAVVSPASDHKRWLWPCGDKWLTHAAVLGSADLCRKLITLGVSSNTTVKRNDPIFDKPARGMFGARRRPDAVWPWTNTGLQTQPSWYRQYHSHHTSPRSPESDDDEMSRIEMHTSPLVEAAVKGHVETVDVLVEAGADFEKRINGCTTVGHLLHSLFHNNINLEARLQILQNLLELGAKVDVPFYDTEEDYDREVSQDTIADMVWQTDCPEAINLVQNYAKACFGQPTVHGILRAAGNSTEELSDLLQNFGTPTSAERLAVEGAALMKAIDKPEVLLNMIKAGVDVHERRDLIYINFGHGALEYRRTKSFVPRNIILEKYLALIADQPFHPFARQILESIPPKAWPIAPFTFAILGVCRTSSSLNLLLQTGAQVEKPFLISAFVQAARDNDHNAMTPLLDRVGDINCSLRAGPVHWDILILAAMSQSFTVRSIGLDIGHEPASIETLDWLVAHGAKISSSVKTLNSIQDLGLSIGFDTERLEWLLAHNIRPRGKSLCGIFMDYVRLRSLSVISPAITTSLFEPSKITGLPLFEPCSAMIDQSGQSVIKDFALVYFIKVGAPTEFLRQLCDSGIDCNTPAKYSYSYYGPLSWHLRMCSHDHRCVCLTPLQAAVCANRIDVVQYFLDKGADTNGGAHYNVLQTACTFEDSFKGDFAAALSMKIQIVECLLRKGADPGRTTGDNLPALRLTIKNFWHDELYYIGDRRLFIEQHLRLLKVLLNASMGTGGFETILTDALRDVPLFVKDGESHKAVTELLLRYKTDIDKRTWRQAPNGDLLMEACRKSDIGKIKSLLDQGVNPNWFRSPFTSGSYSFRGECHPSTPLAVLAAQGNIPLLLLLRAAGAELVRHDNSLECAASMGKLDTVALLLKFEERDVAFARAMMRAHLRHHTTIQMLIEEHLKSKGSDLLENGNWRHGLFYSAVDRYGSRIRDTDFEYDPTSSDYSWMR